jgi:ATP-dependent helicase/nuclease subunit B
VIFEPETRTEAAIVRPAPRIYTVPAGRPFLTELTQALLAGNLPVPGGARPGPFELSDVTLFLPTRRATRSLQEAFLRASSGAALLLPTIKPIFGAAEELNVSESIDDIARGEGRAIGEIERQLALAMLVLRWSEAEHRDNSSETDIELYAPAAARTAAQAANLARELARLMDSMEIEDVDFGRMRTLVPDALAAHWERTLDFLQIVTEYWPAHLREHALISKLQQDKQQVLAQAKRLLERPPCAPVIVAGVMSSVPAVTALLEAVAYLPNGALVLPGLDQSLDEESWQTIVPAHPEHPQYGLKKLLNALDVRREDVLPLPGAGLSPQQKARAALVSQAMRPARTTEHWHRFTARARTKEIGEALAGIVILDAANAEDEAEAVALILREAAEEPGRTAALVSPDRVLARRVAARLATWNLHVENSGGQPLTKTTPGAFLELIIDTVATRFEPVALMALLKHPLCRLGLPAVDLHRGRRTLELAAFRAPYFGQGMKAVTAALERAGADMRAGKRRHAAVRRLRPEDWAAGQELMHRVSKAFQQIEEMFASPTPASLRTLVAAHIAAAEALSDTENNADGSLLWRDEAGEAATKFLATLLDKDTPAPNMRAGEYPDFYRSLARDVNVSHRAPGHPRISIWEPYESRLQHPDVVILGGLNDGIWPQTADCGPWLNRPMRQALGLPPPEERVGDAAHIFTSLLGAPRVYLTRAAKVDGVPTVPSRWLLRLQALLAGVRQTAEAGTPWLAWAQARNALAGPARPVRAPEPRPPLRLRPRQLSVTTIEKWIANPYAIFADRILGLHPLPALGRPPDAALRGQIIHDALGRFATRFPDRLPADTCAELVACAEEALAELTGSPRVAAFWAPRFARFAAWFAETEPARRAGLSRSLAELEGAIVLAGPAGPFTLKARADRIDVGERGLIITDYKTGASLKDLAARAEKGMAPQLPLEAAIAVEGGFAGVAASGVSELRYISTSGGEPPGLEYPLNTNDVAALARQARDGLSRLIAAFDEEATPYRALRRLRFVYRFDDYAHLARVAEWSAETAEEV